MSQWSESVTVRLLGGWGDSFVRAWRASVVGRAFAAAGSALRPVLAASAFCSLRSVRGHPFDDPRSPLSLKVLSAPCGWAVAGLGRTGFGRFFRRAGLSSTFSCLAEGVWFQALGGFALGAGVARIVTSEGSAEQLGAAALALAGTLAIRVGPRLAAEWRRGMMGSLAEVFLDLSWPAAGGGSRGSSRNGSRDGGERAGGSGGAAPAGKSVVRHRMGWFPQNRLSAVVLGGGAIVGGLAGAAPGATPYVVGAIALAATLMVAIAYRAEILLLVLAVFPWLDFVARGALGGNLGGAWDEALLLFSLVAVLFGAVVLLRFELKTVPLTLPLMVAFVAAVGSVLLNDVPTEIGVFALRVTFEPILFFFVAYLVPKNGRWIRYAVGVFLIASVALAVHGLFQYLTGAAMPKAWLDVQEQAAIGTRAFSIIENPNGLGAFLLLGVFLSGSLVLARIKVSQRVLMGLVFAVLTAGVVVTFSRGAWVGLVVGVAAFAALAHRRLLAGLVGVAVLSPVILPEAVLRRVSFGFSGAYLAKSLTAGRLLMWQAALYRGLEHPWFGVGLGTFGGSSAFLFGYGRLWIDNFYLQMAAEGGLILLSAFVWMLWRTGKSVLAGYLDAEDPTVRAIAAGVFGGFVAVCVANVTASVWETLVVGQAFWFLAGMAASLATKPAWVAAANLPRPQDLWAGPFGGDPPQGKKSAGRPARKAGGRGGGYGNREQRRAAAKKMKL